LKKNEETLQNVINLIKSVNSKTSIIFTVSPIRHIKDGFVENTQSKAHLISAIHQLINFRNTIHYFPSYEIMLDELRDYRFYTEDMLHPNMTAINYIWNKFKKAWINENSHVIMDEVEIIQKGLAHKPFNPKSVLHQLFLEKLEVKKSDLQSKFPIIF